MREEHEVVSTADVMKAYEKAGFDLDEHTLMIPELDPWVLRIGGPSGLHVRAVRGGTPGPLRRWLTKQLLGFEWVYIEESQP